VARAEAEALEESADDAVSAVAKVPGGGLASDSFPDADGAATSSPYRRLQEEVDAAAAAAAAAAGAHGTPAASMPIAIQSSARAASDNVHRRASLRSSGASPGQVQRRSSLSDMNAMAVFPRSLGTPLPLGRSLRAAEQRITGERIAGAAEDLIPPAHVDHLHQRLPSL
jgi:hypothetical protein